MSLRKKADGDSPLKPSRKEINRQNRNFGKSVEREVAKRTGGSRTPGSGAIKGSVFNLEGDVRVRDADGRRDLVVVECKGSSGLTPSGEKTFTLKKSVLDQAVREAEIGGAIGAVYIHWKGANFNDDYAVISAAHFYRLIELAKLGAVVEDKGTYP